MFDPKSKKYPYTEYTDQHYIVIKKNKGIVFDEHYPYIDNSKAFRFKRWWVFLLLHLIVFPMNRIRLGFRIKGKDNLKKHKELLSKGVVTISNHIHFWDYICIMCALKPKKPNVLVWAPNVNDGSGGLVRLVGGIPIPKGDEKAKEAYFKALKELFNRGGSLHVYPEGSMWELYQPIRPFHKGASTIACLNNVPILPMAFSYREPGWIRKKIFHQEALLTLNIGEPIFKDDNLTGVKQEEDLTKRSHDAICLLAGINPEDNIYPPIFNKDKRVEY